jgi:preprotein translocase subunit SecG
MTTVLLLIHLFVTIALIGVILIQRSEGGGLGIGTAQGMGSFMTGRGTANLLTRTTAILAVIFFALSLALAVLNRGTVGAGGSILAPPPHAPGAPAAGGSTLPAAPTPGSGGSVPGPTAPKGPSVPTQ